jgi:multiple sugar transport system substrate-binding protein
MIELELSLLAHGPNVVDTLRPFLDRFGARNGVHVEANVFEWETAWSELVKVALYGHGPDVSEVGSTWVGSLIAMNVFQAVDARELADYGGAAAFVPSAWQGALAAGSGEVWAQPWLAYARVLYYRRDLLEQAGVDERTAFQTHEQLERTLSRLAAKGTAAPWAVPTRNSRDTLHNIASWVWSAGGDFASADGKHILFNDKPARAGIRAYFDLHRYLVPAARQMSESDSLFRQGQAAVIMSGPWLWPADASRPSNMTPRVAANIGVAVPLDISFVGYSYLVIWRHSRRRDLALKLVRELTGAEVLAAYAPGTGPLFVRLDMLDHSPLANEPNYQVMARALKTGRAFPSISLWGLIEDKLAAALDNIWQDVLAEVHPDMDAIMNKHLDPLSSRLEMTLAGA